MEKAEIEFPFLLARDGEAYWYTAQRTYEEAVELAQRWSGDTYVVREVIAMTPKERQQFITDTADEMARDYPAIGVASLRAIVRRTVEGMEGGRPCDAAAGTKNPSKRRGTPAGVNPAQDPSIPPRCSRWAFCVLPSGHDEYEPCTDQHPVEA